MLNVKKWNGKPITMPGIVSGMPLDFYHGSNTCIEPSVSGSSLRKIFCPNSRQPYSPLHYWDQSVYNPDRAEQKETESLLMGRAAHHLLFGEADFRKLFVIRPDILNGKAWNGNRLDCKGWLKEAAEKKLSVITADQLERIKRIAGRLAEEPLVKAGILNGLIEHSWLWKDSETGFWLKARPDATPNDSLDYADLKLTKGVSWTDLQYTIRDYGYYQQAGMVASACQALTGRMLNSFTLVFVESVRPHATAIVTLKENEIERGQRANRVALNKFAECWKNKRWPGPNGEQQDARYIEMPLRVQEDIDNAIVFEGGEKK